MGEEVAVSRVAGLDVHARTIAVCVRITGQSPKPKVFSNTFGTMPRQLRAMRDWLAARQVQLVAMEATGVYWMPVYRVLEGHFELIVCNAHYLRRIPGHKTDLSDASWIAKCASNQILAKSFVPCAQVRAVRDYTRYRAILVSKRAAVSNQITRGLELAGIKLSSVVSDVLGKTGRAILQALSEGISDPSTLAALSFGSLRNKRQSLEQALSVELPESTRWVLGQQLQELRTLDDRIRQVEEQIRSALRPFQDKWQVLCQVPGFEFTVIAGIVAEIGWEPFNDFPSARHLASWAGLCPGSNQSGGKERPASINKGNPYLKRLMVQAAWAAVRTKHSRWQSMYLRLKSRRGAGRALIAVAHKLLVLVYQLLQSQQPYNEQHRPQLPPAQKQVQTRKCLQQLEALGYQVVLRPITEGGSTECS